MVEQAYTTMLLGEAVASQRARREVMAPKEPRDLERIGRIGKAGLLLVSDRTPSQEWESFPRQSPKPTRERLGPLKSRKPVGKR